MPPNQLAVSFVSPLKVEARITKLFEVRIDETITLLIQQVARVKGEGVDQQCPAV